MFSGWGCWKYEPEGDGISGIKERVYGTIMQHPDAEGYPTEIFNEVNNSDLVYMIIIPILSRFRRKTGRDVSLPREKEVIFRGRWEGWEEVICRCRPGSCGRAAVCPHGWSKEILPGRSNVYWQWKTWKVTMVEARCTVSLQPENAQLRWGGSNDGQGAGIIW